MNEILISNVAGKVPTVLQLTATKHGLGWNRADGILYGLKIVGGTKTVIILASGNATTQSHSQLHSMTSTADHAAAADGDKDKFIHSNASTGAPEWVTINIPTQYWKKVNNLLMPLTDEDPIATMATISSLLKDHPDDESQLHYNGIFINGKDYLPYLTFLRKGVNGILEAGKQIAQIIFGGHYNNNGNVKYAVQLDVTAGSNNFSSTNAAADLNLKTCRSNSATLESRLRITEAGSMVVNDEEKPTDFRVAGDADTNLFLVKGADKQVGIGTDGNVDTKLHVQTPSDWGKAAMKVEQGDDDKAIIALAGTSAADDTKNISTRTGAGAVSGPKLANSSAPGWIYQGMVKIEVNGSEYWTPYYSPQAIL